MLARATLRQGSLNVPSFELCAEVPSIPFGQTPPFSRALPFFLNPLQVYFFFFFLYPGRHLPQSQVNCFDLSLVFLFKAFTP